MNSKKQEDRDKEQREKWECEKVSDRWKQKQRKVPASPPSPNWSWLSAWWISEPWLEFTCQTQPPPSIPSTPNNPLRSQPALSDKRNEKVLAYLAPTIALCRVSEAGRMMHCLWEGVSFQQLINDEEAIVSCHHATGARQVQIGWVRGKRKGAQLLDGVELSHQDISLWHIVCFASLHISRKRELSTAAAALGIHCHHSPTLHINKSKQTTLLHNLRLQMEYDLNIKLSCKYFRGRRRFRWYWNWVFFWKFFWMLKQIQYNSCFPGFSLHVVGTQLPSYSEHFSSHASTLNPLLCPNGGSKTTATQSKVTIWIDSYQILSMQVY